MRGEPSEEEQVSRGDEGSREFIHVDLKIIFPEISKHRVGSDEGKEAGGALCSYGVHLGCVSILAMKAIIPLAMLVVLPSHGQEAVLDLTELHSYADQVVPPYIQKDNTPPNNRITDLGATLGRVLFYDKRLSTDGTVSCASCHQQEHGFADPAVASAGVAGVARRHSMRLINSRFATERQFFWDERAPTLEFQTSQPIQDHVEMGFSGINGDPDLNDLVERISEIELYQVLFTGVYGDPAITEVRMQRAMAQFVRSIQSFDSKYDAGRAIAPNDGAPFTNFTNEENQGKQLFLGRPGAGPGGGGAGCAACHQPPEFDIDPNSGHNGVIASLGGGQDLTNTRAPSLRDVVNSEGLAHGGFMHNGSLPTLLDVINHYNAIPAVTQGLDPRLTIPGGPPGGPPPQPQRLNLSDTQKDSLVAFLGTLTGTSVYSDPKWSSPFDESNNLSFVVLPATPSVEAGSGQVAVATRGVPNVTYMLKTSPDMSQWSEGIPVIANAQGVVRYTLPQESADRFFTFTYVVPTGG